MNKSGLSSIKNTVLSSKPSTVIRLLLMVLFVSINPLVSFGQCTYPAGATSVGTYTFCIDNSNTITTANVSAGQYALVNVVKGYNYTFSVGNVFNAGNDENLTVYDSSNVILIGNKGNNGYTISNWTSTISGQVKILLSKGACLNDNSTGGPLTMTLNSLNNTQDSQISYGTNTWVGHIYNSVAGASPEPFTNANYAGYYVVNQETINESFGGNTACFPVLSNGTQQSLIYTQQFAVRYLMKSTRAAGYYFMNANADDGIRITVDGVSVLNHWTDHGNITYCNNLIYLNGSSDIIVDYYENGGGNVVGFNLAPISGNSISSYADRNVCSGLATGNLDGSNVFTCANNKTTYQWQSSTDNINFTNISGATLEDYTPPAVTTATVDVKYYRRVLKAFGVAMSASNPATGSVKVTTNPSVPAVPDAIAGSITQCAGSTSQTYNIPTVSNATSYNWTLPANWTITAGIGTNSITVTIPSNGASGNISVNAANGCGNSASSSQWVAVSLPPTGVPVANAATNIQCKYAQLNFTTGSNVTGVYLDIARDNGFTDFISGYNNYNVAYNNGMIPVSNLPAGTLYYRIRGYNSCGVTANSNTISFSTPSPIGGNVSPAQKICSGTSPTNLILTGYSTTNTEILKWQKSSDAAFSSPVDIAVTTPTLSGATIGNLTVDTYFRAVVRNTFGSWCESFSNPVLISISLAPTITPNKVDETCSSSNNGSISPTLSGGLSNVRYIKLTQKYADYQQVAEIQAFEIFTGANIALSTSGAVATGSSVWLDSTGPNYIPSNVNDGVTTGDTFWHSKTNNLDEWVKIDLQSAKNIDYLKIYNRTDCCSTRGQNMLLELFDVSNTLIYSKTVDLYQSGSNFTEINVLDISWADGATTLNRTALDSGTYTLNYADALGCSASSPIVIGATNTNPSTPILGTTTQPDCVNHKGSIVLDGLQIGGTINQTGTATATYTVTAETMTITGLAAGTYNFTASNGSCFSSATENVVMNASVTNTWTTSWSHGTPNSTQKLVFTGDYPPAVDPDVNITGCSCLISGGATVTIKSGRTLTVTNEVNVVGGGTLTFEDTASLVQINDAAINSGDIIYKRTTSSVLNSDYTYWSSPVANQNLNISPYYGSGTFYSYNDFAVPEDWQKETASTTMQIGKGYIIRGPQVSGPPPPPGLYDAIFAGVPNNGIKTIAIGPTGTSNLLGNPYPSAIDADVFLVDNSTIVEGTIYFWTHNTAIQLASGITGVDEFGNPKVGSGALAYTSDDYASYNGTGGAATSGGITPNGKIAAGQAFFTTSIATGATVTFSNTMRLAGTTLDDKTGTNQQFFKTKNTNTKSASNIEKNRIWLNLTNTKGAFKQTLIGYVTDATNDYDSRFDGESFDGNEFVDFYSINQDKNLVIQGRALPFDENDEVPLGYRTTINGEFTINIDQADGSLTNQAVFIEDKLTNKTVNLKEGNYTFNTAAGTFNDRFVLRYTNKTLGTNDLVTQSKQVLISVKNKQIKINSFSETIDKVTIYDVLGRQIYQNGNVNSNEFLITNLVSSHQTLIVKTSLQNGKTVTDKIIY